MNILKPIALVAFTALSFVACKKDDTTPAAATQSGSFTLKGNSYSTDSAAFVISGSRGTLVIGNHDYGRIYTQKDTTSSNLFFVNIDDTTLTAGTLTFDASEDGENYDPKKNYSSAGVYTNLNLTGSSDYTYYQGVDSSSIVVAINNGIYTITYNVVTKDQVVIKGTYTGPITVYKPKTDPN